MHRHRILAQFSLILSILNLVLAAPIVVQKLSVHDARRNEMVIAEDLGAMLKMRRGVEAASDRSMLPRSPSPTGDPETVTPQHSTLSDEPAVSETDSLDPSHSGSLPLSPNPNANLNANPPASLHDSEFSRPSNSEPSLDVPSSSRGPAFLHSPSSASSEASPESEPVHIPPWFSFVYNSRPRPSDIPEWLAQMQADLPPYVRNSWLSHGSSSRPESVISVIQQLQPPGWRQLLLLEAESPSSSPESSRPSSLGSPEIPEAPHPERLQESAPAPPFPPHSEGLSPLASPHSSSSGSSEILLPEVPPESPHPSSPGSSEITDLRLPERLQEFVPAQPASSLPAVLASPPEPPRPSGAGSLDIPEMPLATWLQEFASAPERRPTPQPNEIEQVTSEAHPPPDQFTPEELAPSHHLTSDEPPPSHSSPPTETPPDDRNFFNKELMKDIGIPAAAVIVGGAMITAGALKYEHNNHRDS